MADFDKNSVVKNDSAVKEKNLDEEFKFDDEDDEDDLPEDVPVKKIEPKVLFVYDY